MARIPFSRSFGQATAPQVPGRARMPLPTRERVGPMHPIEQTTGGGDLDDDDRSMQAMMEAMEADRPEAERARANLAIAVALGTPQPKRKK